MKTTAADIMVTEFSTLLPRTPVHDAIKLFQETTRKHGRRLFGLIVTDEALQLVGMLSMYDILLYLRPKHIHLYGTMDDVDIGEVIGMMADRLKTILVGDIMTPDVVTIEADTSLMVILDIMIKKHVRRLPVVQSGRIVGIVYISDLFNQLIMRLGE